MSKKFYKKKKNNLSILFLVISLLVIGAGVIGIGSLVTNGSLFNISAHNSSSGSSSGVDPGNNPEDPSEDPILLIDVEDSDIYF